MKVVATFHPPSSVVGSVSCRLTSGRDVHYLAVATANRIEVFSAAVDGLKLECSADIWGRVVALKIWPAPDGKGADSLVALTDHPDPRLIRYTLNSSDEGETILERKNVLSLVERIGVRESEFLHDVIVNSDGKTAVVSVYTGKLKVVEIDVTTNKLTSFDVICHEYNLLSVSFLGSEKSKHWLGMLYLDHDEKIRLHARELDVKNYELSPSPSVALRPCVPNLGVRTLTDPPPTLISIPKLSFDAGGESDGFRGGVLVIGGAKIRLFELTDARYHKSHRSDSKKSPRIPEDKTGKPRASIVWPWAEVTAWCAANEEGTRYLIGDAYGRIALLSLEVLSTHGIVLMPLGEISPSTSLSYITNQVFFLGSHFGDSQLIRITDEALVSNTVRPPSLYGVDTVESLAQRAPGAPDVKGKGRATEGAPSGKVKGKIIRPKGVYMEIVDTRTNIAPIMDAVLADTDGSGLPQVFTASGGKNTGSVRVVRNGADFADVAHIDGAGNFTGMFPLRQTCESQNDTFVLATDGLMTQLFRMSSSNPRIERVDPTEFSFVSNSPTLAATNMRRPTMVDKKLTYADSSWALQVTPSGVRIVDLDTQTLLSSWMPEEMGPAYAKSEIICADVNESQVLLALPTTGQNHLVLLGIDSGPRLSQKRQLSFSRDITTVSCAPETPGKPFATRVVVGFWDSRVEILSLRGPANTFSSYTPPSELSSLSAIPRSVLLHSFSKEETYLFAGLADGTVVVCAVKGSTLSDRRVFAMGAAPANLAKCTVRGQIAIFGSGSRAAVFSLQSGSLQHSPVLVKGVTTAAPFSSEGWESSILISTQTHLVVGQVRAVNKMQIRTIPFGFDNPVKLAHDPVSKTLGVGCIKADSSPLRELEQPTESVVSSFKILDNTTHEVLSTFTCQPWEEITSVATYTPAGNDARTYYVLGTMFTDSVQRDEPTSGRVILLLPGKADGMSDILTAEATQRVNGCVYAILSVDGHIVAAMNSAVMLFKFKSGPDAELEHVYTWNHDYIVASLVAHGRRIFNGDAVHSVSALELTPARTPTGHTTLSTVARNYGPLWPTALGAWDQNTVIGANADLNLFSFEVQTTADGPRKITVLERDGFFHADDVINKFVQGSLNSADDEQSPELAPRQLYFTASGRIGVVLDMAPELSMKMYGLYRNLAAILSSTQDTSHTKWRTPTGSRGRSDADEEARGFLDGDLLERFLDLAPGSEIVEKVMRGSSAAERLDMSYEQIRGLLETMQGMH